MLLAESQAFGAGVQDFANVLSSTNEHYSFGSLQDKEWPFLFY